MMSCIKCGSNLRATNTYTYTLPSGSTVIVRRKVCVECGEVYTTVERMVNKDEELQERQDQ